MIRVSDSVSIDPYNGLVYFYDCEDNRQSLRFDSLDIMYAFAHIMAMLDIVKTKTGLRITIENEFKDQKHTVK